MPGAAHLASALIPLAILGLAQPAAAETTTVERLVAPDRTTLVDVVPKSGPGLSAPNDDFSAVPSLGQVGRGGINLRSPVAGASSFAWVLQAQNGGVYTDLSMADATHGFASAELGQVYRSTDGATWQLVMNIGFPRYWYGVHAFTPNTVFVSGFQNQSGEGIGRWSTNAGATWTNDIVIDPAHWLTINQFADPLHGVATAIGSGLAYVTTNGGATAGDWSQVLADPTGGWFAGNLTFMPANLYVAVTGISFCQSMNGGLSYTRRSSIDPVFDGGVIFPDLMHGWTGGGQISEPVQGWVHRTTDGGQNWSGRILNPPYPIRSLLFLDESLGFAVGGNYFQGIGGIWSTTDGGQSWNLDVDTGCEMKGIDAARVSADSVSIWCAGSRSGLGRIYRTTVYLPGEPTAAGNPSTPQLSFGLAASPNPFDAGMSVRLLAEPSGAGILDIIDAAGRRVRRLELGSEAQGRRAAHWDGRQSGGFPAASGVYFAVHERDGGVETVRLVLTR